MANIFAVYSAPNQSLDFYYRDNVPNENEEFEGKVVTKVFNNLDNTAYGSSYSGYAPWYTYRSTITNISIVDDIYPQNTAYWFYYMQNVPTADFTKLHTDYVANMAGMFYYSKFTSLDLQHFNTSNVTNMAGMFAENESLITINLANWDTSNVTNMSKMFHYCRYLKLLDIAHFDTSNVTNMSSMLSYLPNLTAPVDISNFDTSKVTNMSKMFQNSGNATATAWGCDLTYDYVKINGDYRT